MCLELKTKKKKILNKSNHEIYSFRHRVILLTRIVGRKPKQ